MKKMMNATADVVDDRIAGLAIANPGLARLEGERVVLRSDGGSRRAVALPRRRACPVAALDRSARVRS